MGWANNALFEEAHTWFLIQKNKKIPNLLRP